jgi:arylsulfatase A
MKSVKNNSSPKHRSPDSPPGFALMLALGELQTHAGPALCPFLLILLGLTTAVTCVGAEENQPARPPNIVFILADDLGIECVSALGGQSYSTPNIDKLAADGMKFTHCFSAPACSPTRAQLLTGLYPFGNGIAHVIYKPGKHQEFLSPEKFTSFASLLKKKGYATAMAGKWQLSFLQDHDTIRDFGFDEYCAWQIFDGKKKTSRHYNPTLRRNGKTVKYSDQEYGPDVLCEFSLDFIQRNRDKPFCLYYCSLLPHFPWVPTPDSQDQTMPKGALGNPRFFPDMVDYLDKIVGKITHEIDRLGLAEDTIIIFTGDNGTDQRLTSLYQDRSIPGGKGTMRDTGVRVPFVVRQPGRIKAGSQSSALVDFSDILPTFCTLAGTPVPEGLHGRSFHKLLDDPTQAHREWVYYEYLTNKAVRTAQSTLVAGKTATTNAALGAKTSPASNDDQRMLEQIMKKVLGAKQASPTTKPNDANIPPR